VYDLKIKSISPKNVQSRISELIKHQNHKQVIEFDKELDHFFYSNIFNDFTDEEIDELEQNWEVVKEYKNLNVCVILYQKK